MTRVRSKSKSKQAFIKVLQSDLDTDIHLWVQGDESDARKFLQQIRVHLSRGRTEARLRGIKPKTFKINSRGIVAATEEQVRERLAEECEKAGLDPKSVGDFDSDTLPKFAILTVCRTYLLHQEFQKELDDVVQLV